MALTKITPEIVAVNAIQGTLIADNAITAVHIATNAVSGTLIADNAVTATHIAQNVITVTQLADDAVEADKIADGVITTNHLNKAMISSQTAVTAVGGDYVLIGDTSDSNNLKKALVSDFGNDLDAAVTINESGADVDFRVESNGNANMLFVDGGNNRVGINAGTTPLRELDARDGDGVTSLGVGNNAAYIARGQDGTHAPKLVFDKSQGSLASPTDSANGNYLGQIIFRGYHTNGHYSGAQIDALLTGTNGTSDMPSALRFLTSADGSSTPTERMRIDSSGNVGIGTTSPATELQIGDYSDNLESITIATASDQTGRINFYNANASEGASMRVTGGGAGAKMYFANRYNTDADRVTFDLVNGRVGIGATSPGQTLDVRGGAVFNEDGGDYDFRIESDGNSNMFWVDASTNHICIGSDNQQSILSIDGPDDAITMNISSSMAATGDWNGIAFGARNSMKGAILYERTTNYARGRLVIAVDDTADTSDAAIADAAMYINNNKSVEVVGDLHIANPPTDNPNAECPILMRNASNSKIIQDSITYNAASDQLTINSGLFLTSGYIRSGAADFSLGTAAQGSMLTLSNTNGNLVFNKTGDGTAAGTITHHTNNFFYIKGGSESLIMGTDDLYGSIQLAPSTNNSSWNVNDGAAITINGSTRVCSGDFNDTSDVALKENITNITGGLSIIKQLQPRNFDWKEEAKADGAAGFIAQEVATVLPNEVQGEDYSVGTKDEHGVKTGNSMGKTIKLAGILAHAVKAIQELEARVKTLEG